MNEPICHECGGRHEPSGARSDCILHWKRRAVIAENELLVAKCYSRLSVCTQHEYPYAAEEEGGPICPWCERSKAEKLFELTAWANTLLCSATPNNKLMNKTREVEWCKAFGKWFAEANEALAKDPGLGNYPKIPK